VACHAAVAAIEIFSEWRFTQLSSAYFKLLLFFYSPHLTRYWGLQTCITSKTHSDCYMFYFAGAIEEAVS